MNLGEADDARGFGGGEFLGEAEPEDFVFAFREDGSRPAPEIFRAVVQLGGARRREAGAGGGMVSVKMNGQKQLLSLQIDTEVFTGGDKDMLQDLIVAAVNEGIRKVDEAMTEQLGGLTGGLKIPGLF